MATYIMLSGLTDDGRKALNERPERLQQVNQEIESLGVRVVAQYCLLGEYDFLNVIEAPDNETMTRLALELAARGTLQTTTLPAISVSAFVDLLRGPED